MLSIIRPAPRSSFSTSTPRVSAEIGVWPWPRSTYAKLIERLVAADAAEIVLDVDLSSKSTEREDAALERALRDAGGFVLLASFLQAEDAEGPRIVNRPLPRFADNATLVSVNVPGDADGLVRRYRTGYTADGVTYPTIGAALALRGAAPEGEFAINFGMDIASVPRYSFRDVLNGTIGADQLSGRQIIVGASALELRDSAAVPRFGILPGSMVHLIAAENLKQGIDLKEVPTAASVLLALVVSLLVGLIFKHGSTRAAASAVGAIAIMVEVGAIVLLSQFALMVDTFVIHSALIAFGMVSLGYELASRGSMLDSTTRAHAETRNVLDRVISNNFDGIVVCDSGGTILMSSRLAEEVLGKGLDLVGCAMDAVLPRALDDLMRKALAAPEDALQGRLSEMEIVSSGTSMIIEFVITVSVPEQVAGLQTLGGRVACLTFRDVTSRRANEERLRYLAGHDPLTGLVTRNRLVDIVNVAMADPQRRAAGITVFLLDLSRFKAINDSLGHSYGDAVLQQVAKRLRTGEVSVVARLGGDQFAMIRPGVFSGMGTESFCDAILRRVSDVYSLGEHRAIVGARMGVTTTAVSGYDPEALLSHADMALSAAKRLPGNAFYIYTPEMEQKLRESQNLEIAMRQALELNQMHLAYQPQVSLADGRLIGVEALVRWNHPQLGPIPPAKFIPVAEETGLIIELGRWILMTACREAAELAGRLEAGGQCLAAAVRIRRCRRRRHARAHGKRAAGKATGCRDYRRHADFQSAPDYRKSGYAQRHGHRHRHRRFRYRLFLVELSGQTADRQDQDRSELRARLAGRPGIRCNHPRRHDLGAVAGQDSRRGGNRECRSSDALASCRVPGWPGLSFRQVDAHRRDVGTYCTN